MNIPLNIDLKGVRSQNNLPENPPLIISSMDPDADKITPYDG